MPRKASLLKLSIMRTWHFPAVFPSFCIFEQHSLIGSQPVPEFDSVSENIDSWKANVMCRHEIDMAIFTPEEFLREATGLKDHEFPSHE